MRNHLFATLAVSAAMVAEARAQTMQLTPPRIGGFTSLVADGTAINDASPGGSSGMLATTGTASFKADNPRFLADPPGSMAGASSTRVAGPRVNPQQGFGATSTSPIDAPTFDEGFSLRFSGGVPTLMAGAEASRDLDADGVISDFNVSMIPEPATLAMAVLGMLALPVAAGIIRRRRAGRSS